MIICQAGDEHFGEIIALKGDSTVITQKLPAAMLKNMATVVKRTYFT